MSGHYNKVFNRKIIVVLQKAGFTCQTTTKDNKNKYWISKNGGERYLVHSGEVQRFHKLKRFLKETYSYELSL